MHIIKETIHTYISASQLKNTMRKFTFALATLVLAVMFSNSTSAAPPVLAESPLGKSLGGIKPNMMFVFDTSLSMTSDKTNDALDDYGQCKAATKDKNGVPITTLNISSTTLTVTAPGHNRSPGDIIDLAIPGAPQFSGVYRVLTTNAIAGTAATCTARNSAVIINSPYCYGATGGSPGNPMLDPPVPPTPACSCNPPTPVNVLNTASGTWISSPGSTNPAVCAWYDPRDNAIGENCTAWSGGTAGTPATTFTVTIDPLGASDGNLPAAALIDASVLPRGDDSKCYYNEPPLASSQIQSLFYNPSVQYVPPPWPKKVGLGITDPANRLPSMTRTYTSNWNKVSIDGTRLDASGDPYRRLDNLYGRLATGWDDMVYCDTPNRPGVFASDNLWLESTRCKKNDLASNTVLKSPNYPYLYPSTIDGGVLTPSKTKVLDYLALHQNGVAMLTTDNPVADVFAFGERYSFAKPFYYSVTPIEYCNSAKLNNCVLSSTATGPYTYPAYVRYCVTPAQATDTSTSPGAISCQGVYAGSGSYRFARYGLFSRVDVTPLDASFIPKTFVKSAGADGRTDCAGTTCTYDEEMTNMANWYAYYRTRIQLMKSAAGRTFDTLNDNYRVGLITVENYNTAGNYLPIKDFATGTNYQKENWFKALYSRTPGGGTSLRDVLGTVGRIYAGRKPITSFTATADDPVQYSCQKNFTLLTTDGYWNGIAGKNADIVAGAIGNQDAAAPVTRPQLEGNTAIDTLADVAQYYYQTDIRDPSFSNCTGALGTNVCQNDVIANGADANTAQHMATFTLGLGVDGQLSSTDYKTAPVGDYADLISGATKWPVPGADNGDATITLTERATVDDLWHAAVNGRGTYFSARSPAQLISGLTATLGTLTDAVGTATASSVSNSTPAPGDNYVFSARYLTGSWTGNLFVRTIAGDGSKSAGALWCIEAEKSVTPECNPSAATGLASKVNAHSDTRTIYANISGSLDSFLYNKLTAAQKANFDTANISALSQWGSYSAFQLTKAGGDSLVDYLRGQTSFDNRLDNIIAPPAAADNRLYRQRGAILGDIVDSDPIFVGTSRFSYTDAGYAAYIAATSAKTRMVYVGANDGMLHAFKADSGEEAWAFVPTDVMPNLWKLADFDYRNMHTNFVNGEITVADIYDSGTWKTILVGGLGQGGKAFYALDISNPLSPTLLWELNSSALDLGFSYGKPVVTKRASDNKWVVLITSGYNNTTGLGKLYVLDAKTGGDLSSGGISTGVGSAVNPSGLAQVSAFATNPGKNNLAQYVYGGDLFGNVWRFDITDNTVIKLTTLKTNTNIAQPITTGPSLGLIKSKRVVFMGTGKYLESGDLLTAGFTQQTIYAIKDTGADIPSIRSTMVEQTLTASGLNRVVSTTADVDWSTKNGWFVDLPASESTGERQNIDSVLVSGALVVPTFIPPSGVCGVGTGWINVFDYTTGGALAPTTIASSPVDGGVGGFYITFDSAAANGKFRINIDKGSGATETGAGQEVITQSSGEFGGSRSIWRELIQ